MVIKFFASLKEQLNCEQEKWQYFEKQIRVSDVIKKLSSRGEPWVSALESTTLLVAINQEIANFDDTIAYGDELAIFPPVTGG